MKLILITDTLGKMKRLICSVLYVILTIGLYSCDKIEKKMQIPDYSYRNSKIDEFYYINETVGNSQIIPLIKPYDIMKSGSPQEWGLATYDTLNELGNVISPIQMFNVHNIYIYGYKPFEKDDIDSKFNSPETWFILNTVEKKLIFFDKESEFKAELKNLNLPEEMLTPDAVFEQYKNNPVLPWFPEDIKKQLEEVKKQKGN